MKVELDCPDCGHIGEPAEIHFTHNDISVQCGKCGRWLGIIVAKVRGEIDEPKDVI